jgi:tryptophan synthase alpha chain
MPAPTRVDVPFTLARQAEWPVLVGYLPAGYPTLETSPAALRALAQHVDVIELGVPRMETFAAPLHRSAARAALDSGATAVFALDLIRHLATVAPSTPVLLNPPGALTARYGERFLAAALASAGAAGVVLPDVHPEGTAAVRWADAAAPHQLATVYVCGPDQLGAAARASTGCVYLPGAATPTSRNIDAGLLGRRRGQVRRYAPTNLPVLVGRGINSPQQAAALARYGDGIAVGSALIRAAESALDPAAAVVHIDFCASRFAAALRPRTATSRAAA